MPQQHAQFEEEFRDGPQPHVSYQETYREPPPVTYSVPAPTPQLYVSIPGQNFQVQTQNTGNNVGARLALAIVSMFFVFIMFIVAVATSGSYGPVAATAFVFALIFAVVVVILNVIFNRRRKD